MTNVAVGDVWFVKFPLEEDIAKFIKRPVVVLDVEKLEVLSVKVTKSKPRTDDDYDTPIVYWKKANLHFQSTARISKTIYIDISMFDFKIGELYKDDLEEIEKMYMYFVDNNENYKTIEQVAAMDITKE